MRTKRSGQFEREAKFMAWFLFGLPVLGLVVGLLMPVLLTGATLRCEARNGIWMTESLSCQLPSCVEAHTCRPSYSNSEDCENLQPGISEQQLIQHLGEPIEVSDRALIFEPSATKSTRPRAMLDSNGKVELLNCRWGGK